MRYILFLSSMFLFFNMLNAQVQVGSDIDGEAQDDYFGSSLSISADGQFLAVGAELNDGNGSSSGHVRVFQKMGTSWVQRGADINGADAGDYAGTVAMSDDGNRIVIGSEFSNANGGASGHTRVFEYNGSAWNQLGSDIDGEAAFDYAGHVVSMSDDGNTIAIGATHNDGQGLQDCGHTRLYTFVNGNWVQKGADIDGEASGDTSGWSTSLSSDGNTIAIGSYRNNGNGTESGHVRVFDFVGGSWVQKGADIDGQDGDRFGWDVALSADGNTFVAGGTHNTNSVGYQAGVARVYTYVGGTWTQVGQELYGENLVDWFGYSVAISADGNVIASSAIRNDGNGSDAGNVKVFQLINSTWVQVGTDIESENAHDWNGYTIDMSADGTMLVVGALNNDPTGNTPYTGHVRCFDMSGLVMTSVKDAPKYSSNTAFPNPNNGQFVLDLGEEMSNVTITIRDVSGMKIYQNDFKNINATNLNLNGDAGVYFVEIVTPDQPTRTIKVLKM